MHISPLEIFSARVGVAFVYLTWRDLVPPKKDWEINKALGRFVEVRPGPILVLTDVNYVSTNRTFLDGITTFKVHTPSELKISIGRIFHPMYYWHGGGHRSPLRSRLQKEISHKLIPKEHFSLVKALLSSNNQALGRN